MLFFQVMLNPLGPDFETGGNCGGVAQALQQRKYRRNWWALLTRLVILDRNSSTRRKLRSARTLMDFCHASGSGNRIIDTQRFVL
jgi:hypothetical protein